MQLSEIPVHAPGVVSRLVDGEAVIVHPRQGVVRVLNPVGARVWELADGKRSIAALIEDISEEYDVDGAKASSDTLAFLTDLVNRGLLIIAIQ